MGSCEHGTFLMEVKTISEGEDSSEGGTRSIHCQGEELGPKKALFTVP